MTMNGAVLPVMAMYIVAAQEQVSSQYNYFGMFDCQTSEKKENGL